MAPPPSKDWAASSASSRSTSSRWQSSVAAVVTVALPAATAARSDSSRVRPCARRSTKAARKLSPAPTVLRTFTCGHSQPEDPGRRGEHGTFPAQGQRHMLRGAVRDQGRGGLDLAFAAFKGRAKVQPQLPAARLHEKNPLGECLGQGGSGGVHDAARIMPPREPRHLGIEILRDPRREASAGHDIPADGNRIRHERQAQTPLGLTQLGALQHEAELLACRRLVDREVLAGTPWIGTARVGTRSASMSRRYASPVGPPAV